MPRERFLSKKTEEKKQLLAVLFFSKNDRQSKDKESANLCLQVNFLVYPSSSLRSKP